MIRDFENMGREEMIQYICLVINYFYNMYDYFTMNEREYLKKYIDMLNEVYNL